MRRVAAILFCVATCAVATSGCYYDNVTELYPATLLETCDTAAVITYTLQVAQIMTTRCGAVENSCHQGVSSSNGIDLSSYAGVSIAADGTLMDAVNHTGTASPMPQGGGMLSACNIATLQKWIDTGKAN